MKHTNKLFVMGGLLMVAALASCGTSGTGNAIDAKVTALPSAAYVYKGEQSTTQVSFYSGIIFSLRDEARKYIGKSALDADGDGTITLKELHDAKAVIGHMGATSGSGYIYPTFMLYQAGYTKGFVTADEYEKLSDADKALAFIGVDQVSYPASIDSLMTGKLDATCGFMDTRYGSAYVQADSKYKGNDKLFSNTYTVAITDPIMNDTVSVYANLADAKKTAISAAFKKAVTDGSKTTEGTAAYLIYQIYSHTGYIDAKDSDYDSARTMYQWTLAHTNKAHRGAVAPVASIEKADTPETIKIQLVPSNDPATLLTRAKALAPILNSYNLGYNFDISVGDSYAATTTALANGQLDAGFLTASGYAQCTIEHPGAVQVLLSASRAGYKVQADDFPGFTEAAKALQLKAMNGQIDAKGNAVK